MKAGGITRSTAAKVHNTKTDGFDLLRCPARYDYLSIRSNGVDMRS